MGRPSSYTPEKVQKASIYGLVDPRDGAVRYVGKANNPANRLKSHLRDCRRRKTPVYAWMRKLLLLGHIPMVTVLEADCADWRESERRIIADYRERGERLLNVAEGGDAPHCPLEVRRANGRKCNAKTRSMLPNRGGKDTRETLVLDTYNWLHQFYLRTGRTERAEQHREKMRQLAADEPEHFGVWA